MATDVIIHGDKKAKSKILFGVNQKDITVTQESFTKTAFVTDLKKTSRKIDAMEAKAIADHKAGKTRKLP